MMLVRWKPRFGLARPDEFDRFFDDMFNVWRGSGSSEQDRVWLPSVDVAEKDGKYELKAELPGLKRDDIQVEYEDGELVLRGERNWENEDKQKDYHRIERRYGKFERRFALPDEINNEDIKAKYEDGVLHVEVPKVEAPEPKKIAIEVK